ncbi:MAG: tRNA (adenosine(37)-N6)-threonylcarbamoyltransferase complex ATPase subunit type 1 TsaE [Deltaproteobacteria bacterium]|nr:tRNA (adenosine(37)-N6)-threonylcarbamoyltransferase complex ATPase subunit type 1 TsaE [Deltaproteobacteria bacterium]MDZ4225063.1 tRNA (adenosine(37)-N6)-threonylcarbamoyltransferase complex ATPase subunit type 1 TsaE [bacterium]
MTYVTHSDVETKEVARQFAADLQPGSVLALVGNLGAGKTCFVQGLAKGLGVPETVTVSSPTYVLIHEYAQGRLPLYHFDFYRLQKKEETHGLNLEEYFEGKGVSVVEWADHFPEVFPEKTRWIYFGVIEENVRELKFRHPGESRDPGTTGLRLPPE